MEQYLGLLMGKCVMVQPRQTTTQTDITRRHRYESGVVPGRIKYISHGPSSAAALLRRVEGTGARRKAVTIKLRELCGSVRDNLSCCLAVGYACCKNKIKQRTQEADLLQRGGIQSRLKGILLFTLFLVARPAEAQTCIPPEKVGLSPERLSRIKQTFQGLVDEGKIAGATTLISRKGQIAHWDSYGYMDLEAQRPMAKDAIFRIASMTKAVTAVAVLQLLEQGHFQLDDPIETYIPVFKKARVLDPNQAGADPNHPRTVPLERPITIRDMLRHTPGIYGGRRFTEAGLRDWQGSLADYVETLVSVPLACQPGARFQYSFAIDVLGHLVEVLSDQRLDAYFKEQIFAPLGMDDTGFVVPPDKLCRLTNHYLYREGKLICKEKASESPFLKRAAALSGGGGWSYSYPGLVTTAADWWRFMEMLRRGGRLNGVRILSRPTVQLMCADHLGDIPGHFEPGTGHGIGVGVVTDSAQHGQLASTGTIYWAGGPHNTYYFVDFQEQMCGLMFMQNAPFGHLNLMRRFLVLAHQAIDD